MYLWRLSFDFPDSGGGVVVVLILQRLKKGPLGMDSDTDDAVQWMQRVQWVDLFFSFY